MTKVLVMIVGLALVVCGGIGCARSAAEAEPKAHEATPSRGEVAGASSVRKVRATGTVEAEEFADVGAVVPGKIVKFGWDPRDDSKPPDERRPIDYCSPVKGPQKDDKGTVIEEGTLLAVIDDDTYRAQVRFAESNLMRAQAETAEAAAKFKLAEATVKNAKERLANKQIEQSEYDLAEAGLGVACAAVVVAEATVAHSQTVLEVAKVNLAHTRITSPLDGVIIDRRVNIGQVVGPSPNTPSLFLIAKDMKKCQVWASVNEADITQIRPHQHVSFTVDAFPREKFDGEVVQIRLNASMTQNVVTYTVVIAISDAKGKLLPYLTANVLFE